MGPLCSLPTLVLAGNCTVLQAFQDEREGPAFSLQGSCTQAAASCMPIMACHGHPRPAILPCGCFPASHSLCACHSPTAPTRVSALLLSAGLTLARLQGLQSTLSNHNSPGPVPRAGCRDCGLQDTSWSKEVLDRLYTSNFAVKVSLSRRSGWSPRPSDSRLAVLPPWGAGAWSVMLAASGCQMLAQPPVHKPSDASRADPCYCHKPQHPTLRLRAGAKPRATLTQARCCLSSPR
nr:uncharacterized protein LOC110152205 isoform X1 [Odocoileus virginianus texanus]